MSEVDITELLATNEVPELITQCEIELNGWQKFDINEIHDKITLLLMLYLHNNEINKSMILLSTFNAVFLKDGPLSSSEHKIKLLMLCSFIQSLIKTSCHLYIKEKYLEELIGLNTSADNKKVNFYIKKSTALIHYEKAQYKESEILFLIMAEEHITNSVLLYDIYLCMIELYETTKNMQFKHETILNTIPLICDIYKSYNLQIYGLLYFINIYIDDRYYDRAQHLCDLGEQILQEHYKDIQLLYERDEYYFKIGEKKMQILLSRKKYIDILIKIDNYINSMWISDKSKIIFYEIKLTTLTTTNKMIESVKIYNIIESYIYKLYGDGSAQMLKHILNKLYISCSLCDLRMYTLTLNKIYNLQKTISGTLLLSYNKIYIIKQNNTDLMNVFKDISLDIHQECLCGKINITREPYTICNKCKSVFYCSKQCKQKYKKSHAKKCICI